MTMPNRPLVLLLALALVAVGSGRLTQAEDLIPAKFEPFVSKAETPKKVTHVVHISVDGLGAHWLKLAMKQQDMPGFKRLMGEGSGTLNARTDFDYTITLPNHTCMVTGRPVNDVVCGDMPYAGHTWTINDDNQPVNLHGNRRDYICSVFDVAHDNGLRTELYSTKSKFKLYADSYSAGCGAPDKSGADNGRCKIDRSVIEKADSGKMMKAWVESYKSNAPNYSFVHFHDCDSAGHGKGWGTPEYMKAMKAVDDHLITILNTIQGDPKLRDNTVVILSADHGGQGRGHSDKLNPLDYLIPFYVWGAGVPHGGDLYAMNKASRLDPGLGRPAYNAPQQPIRNGDGGNLALSLLGLPQIPGSLINMHQDLVAIPDRAEKSIRVGSSSK